VGELRAVAITPTPDIRTALFNIFFSVYENTRGRDSPVGIANRHGLDGPGIESAGVRISAPVQNGAGAQPASYTMDTGSLSRGKAAGACR
jgi:hypothetical protein